MEIAENPQEDSVHNALMNILPEDGLTFGQSQESGEEKTAIANAQPEVKTEAPAGAQPNVKPDAKPDDAAAAAAAEPDEVEIDFEGSKYRLPKELKDAFLRQQDYTKKTMELAEQRKALPANPKEVDGIRQKLTHYEALLGDAVAKDAKTDWIKLLDTDPIEYLKQKELADARRVEWQQTSAQRNTELAEQQRQALFREGEQLIAKLPEWKDEAVFKADREKIVKSLTEVGYKPEEINSIADHRALIIADKARRYDELMAAKTEVVKKIEKLPPKVERPGVSSDGQVNKTAMTSLRKTGSIDDAAAALRSLMG